MESSPLTQQSRPEAFQPKIVQLYEHLFNLEEAVEPSEGLWREFFLLPPDKVHLRSLLQTLTADDLLHLQTQTQRLFARAVLEAGSDIGPRNRNALETLTAFLGGVLTKKYTNPSSDVIAVLAGLDQVDPTISDFVKCVDGIIRNGAGLDIRQRAIEAALSMAAGAYQTGLFIHDSDTPVEAFEPFLLLGLLSNYNKFEFQNPYQLRLDDFVNESTIQIIVRSIGSICVSARNSYVTVQDDLPEGWNLHNTLIYFGLGRFAPGAKIRVAPPSADEAKELFAALPPPEAAVLLPTYDFTNANKLFGYNLVTLPPEKKQAESPFGAFLSFTSYLLQHAHRSHRVSLYAVLNLFTLQILIEDQVLCKRICSEEGKITVRLCRQRQPYIPLVHGDRVLATTILDVTIDAVTHNLRRRLDVNLYALCIGILLRIISHLSRSKTRLQYHWSELWRTLLSLIRFLTTYSSDIISLLRIHSLLDPLINLIAFCLSAGETFLPDPASYDDLFYKLVETGDILTKFRNAYNLSSASTSSTLKPTSNGPPTQSDNTGSANYSIDVLTSVSSHYHSLLEEHKSKGYKKNLLPHEVQQVIKSGYETLSIQAKEGLDAFTRWRESERKADLKKIARCAVEDARRLMRNR